MLPALSLHGRPIGVFPFLTLTAVLGLAGCVDSGGGGSSSRADSGEASDTSGGSTEAGSLTLGSGTGDQFTEGKLDLGIADGDKLANGGSTAVQARVLQGDEPAGEVTVSFTSSCSANGKAEFSSPEPATDTDGVARTTYTADGCEGSDTITASLEGDAADATATLSIAEPSLGSLAFVSAEPTHIGLQGMAQEPGEARQSTTGTVRFRLRDQSGEPLAGVPITFDLTATVGGLELSRDSAVSNANGEVTTTVQAGSVATPVRVTANAGGADGIQSQSEQLWVGTGLPVGEDLTLAADTLNPPIGRCMGEEVTITTYARDRFGHPVPDGTTILFSPEAGTIVESACQTEDGGCSVTWRSQKPLAGDRATLQDGRATILAYTIGEEGFIDHDGDGRFGSAEAAAGASAWTDTGEPYRDNNRNGTFEPGTDGFLYDYDEDGQRTGTNGQFDGVLCEADDGSCREAYAPIGEQLELVLSGNNVRFDTAPPAPPDSHSVSGDGDLTVAVSHAAADGSSQPLPAETTLELADLPKDITVGEAEREMPGTNTSGPWTQTFQLGAEGTAESGKAKITVTVPGNNCHKEATVTRRFTLKP